MFCRTQYLSNPFQIDPTISGLVKKVYRHIQSCFWAGCQIWWRSDEKCRF